MAEKLHCPRCATAFIDGTSYCRTCGLALAGVSALVSGDVGTAPKSYYRPSIRKFGLGVGLFILALVIGLLNAILRDFGLFPERYGKMVFLGFVILALLTIGSAFLFPTKVYAKRKRGPAEPGDDSPVRFDTNPLAGELATANPMDASTINLPQRHPQAVNVAPPSVTEQTTRHLD